VKRSLEYAIIDIGISRLFPTREGTKNNVGEETGDMLTNIPIFLVKCNLSMSGN